MPILKSKSNRFLSVQKRTNYKLFFLTTKFQQPTLVKIAGQTTKFN